MDDRDFSLYRQGFIDGFRGAVGLMRKYLWEDGMSVPEVMVAMELWVREIERIEDEDGLGAEAKEPPSK